MSCPRKRKRTKKNATEKNNFKRFGVKERRDSDSIFAKKIAAHSSGTNRRVPFTIKMDTDTPALHLGGHEHSKPRRCEYIYWLY